MEKKTKIKYFDLWGSRKEKYKFLESHDVKNTKWQELELKDPYYFFVPKDTKGEKIYQSFISLKNIFGEFGSGVITRRDEFAVADSREALERRIRLFLDKNFSKEMIIGALKINDTYEWDLEQARSILREYENLEDKFSRYLYRIFDERWIFYDDAVVSRTSVLLRNNLFNKENLALLATRILSSRHFRHTFVSNIIGDICTLSNKGKETNYYFPLYLYREVKTKKKKSSHKIMMLFDKPKHGYQTRTSNINKKLLEILKGGFGEQPSPEKIFYYIYAILYSNIYREKYNEFLKIDFPRIPFTKDFDLFKKASKIGQELVELHLLKSTKLQKTKASFPTVGDSIIQKREYNAKEKRIYINDKQYFQNIEAEIWNYYIGGYQVLDKWLKDRIGKTLSAEDIKHYLKVITAIKHTIELQKEIDQLYSKVEKSLIKNHLILSTDAKNRNYY